MRYLVGTIIALTMAFAPTTAEAASRCTSTFQKLTKGVKKLGPVVAKLGCGLANDGDAAAAESCQSDIDEALEKIEKGIGQWNKTFPSKAGTIGPRGIRDSKSWSTGALNMERLFIGPPVVNNSTVVEFKRTGGKSKAKFEVRVCFVDPLTGNDKKTKTFRSRGDKLRFKHTFKSMASTVPMILLKSKRPKPLQNTKYKIRVYQGGGTVSATSGKGKSSAKKPKARRASSKSRKRKGSSKSRKRKRSRSKR